MVPNRVMLIRSDLFVTFSVSFWLAGDSGFLKCYPVLLEDCVWVSNDITDDRFCALFMFFPSESPVWARIDHR